MCKSRNNLFITFTTFENTLKDAGKICFVCKLHILWGKIPQFHTQTNLKPK